VRAQELMRAKWEEFNIEERIWTIPPKRMKMRKSHTVYLSDQALLILDKIKAENFHTEYLFYNKEKFSVIKNERLINSLYKIGYKGKMTAHGFRALASTILNEQGFNPDIIERQLAHVDPNSVRRAYNRAEYIKDRNDMMQWWSNFILEQCPNFIESKQETLNL
jgi:integrase